MKGKMTMTRTQYEMLCVKLKEAHEILCQAENDAIALALKDVIERSLLLLSTTQTFISAAFGENLDRLGMMYGFERLGRSDDEFRAFIRENVNAIDERGR
jgi:hypothetical protein